MVIEQKHSQSIYLGQFLLEFLRSKFKNMEPVVQVMLGSVVFSAFKYREKYPDCDIFYKFVSDLYHPLELSYFIFIRAIVERETGQIFFESQSTKLIDIRQLYISKKQIHYVVDNVFGCGNTIKISRFNQKLYETFPELRVEEQMKTYTFLNFALFDYYRCRRTSDRRAEEVKGVDQVMGINAHRLHVEQTKAGINHRLIKGRQIGTRTRNGLRNNREIDDSDEFLEEVDPGDKDHARNLFKDSTAPVRFYNIRISRIQRVLFEEITAIRTQPHLAEREPKAKQI